jgi:hypothetical protein
MAKARENDPAPLAENLQQEIKALGADAMEAVKRILASAPVRTRYPREVREAILKVWDRSSADLRLLIADQIKRPVEQIDAWATQVQREAPSRRTVRAHRDSLVSTVQRQLKDLEREERRTSLDSRTLSALERKLKTRQTILQKVGGFGVDVRAELARAQKLLSALADYRGGSRAL